MVASFFLSLREGLEAALIFRCSFWSIKKAKSHKLSEFHLAWDRFSAHLKNSIGIRIKSPGSIL